MADSVKTKFGGMEIVHVALPDWVESAWNVLCFVGATAFLIIVTVVEPVMGATLWTGILLSIWLMWRFRRPPQRPPRRPPPTSPPGMPPLSPAGTPVIPKGPDDVLIGKHEEPIPVRRVAQA